MFWNGRTAIEGRSVMAAGSVGAIAMVADGDADPLPLAFLFGALVSRDGEDAPGEVVEREVGACGHGEERLHGFVFLYLSLSLEVFCRGRSRTKKSEIADSFLDAFLFGEKKTLVLDSLQVLGAKETASCELYESTEP